MPRHAVRRTAIEPLPLSHPITGHSPAHCLFSCSSRQLLAGQGTPLDLA